MEAVCFCGHQWRPLPDGLGSFLLQTLKEGRILGDIQGGEEMAWRSVFQDPVPGGRETLQSLVVFFFNKGSCFQNVWKPLA